MPDQIRILNEQLQILWEEVNVLRRAATTALAFFTGHGTTNVNEIVNLLTDALELGENNDNSSPA